MHYGNAMTLVHPSNGESEANSATNTPLPHISTNMRIQAPKTPEVDAASYAQEKAVPIKSGNGSDDGRNPDDMNPMPELSPKMPAVVAS